jgi:hypothetical protein
LMNLFDLMALLFVMALKVEAMVQSTGDGWMVLTLIR